jgi:hypothetical protein
MTAGEGTAGPPFPIGGPTSSSWREVALTRIAELHALTIWLARRRAEEGLAAADELVETVKQHLDTAKASAGRSSKPRKGARLWALIAGADVERVTTNLDAANADILRLAPLSYLRGQMPSMVAEAGRHLPTGDPRRLRLEEIAREARHNPLAPLDQEVLVAVMRGVSSAARREIARVRSFRNVLLVTALVLTLIAGGLVVLGASAPDAIPLCFSPGDHVVCPTHQVKVAENQDVDALLRSTATGWDLPLIAMVGAIAAAVAAAVALRNVRGTSTPYSLPIALAILKLPTGALTAVLGILLMRGQFVPGLSALDFPAQIVAWAVVFGYAQQLFTRLVDQQAHSVLDDVGGSVSKASVG